MKAVVFKEHGALLAVEQIPEPTPGWGDVVVKVGRCGICGTDLHMTEKHDLARDGAALDAASRRTLEAIYSFFPVGAVLGHEFSGEVVALGPGVERLRIGDRIASMAMKGCGKCLNCLNGDPLLCAHLKAVGGGYGEYTLVGDRACIKLPDALSLADGALIEPLAVGLRACVLAEIDAGARILVMGAGPIGLAVIYWARRLGAGRIVATARTSQRAGLALKMGANGFLAPGSDDGAVVNEALHGPPDVVFECIGVPGMIPLAASFVRPRGTVIVLGSCFAADPLVPGIIQLKEIRIQFAVAYTLREFQVCVDTLDGGSVEPRAMITDSVSLDDLPEAFDALRRRTTQCKVIVDPQAH